MNNNQSNNNHKIVNHTIHNQIDIVEMNKQNHNQEQLNKNTKLIESSSPQLTTTTTTTTTKSINLTNNYSNSKKQPLTTTTNNDVTTLSSSSILPSQQQQLQQSINNKENSSSTKMNNNNNKNMDETITNNRTLSVKERKEMFNKTSNNIINNNINYTKMVHIEKSPPSNHYNHNQSPQTQINSNNKRQKIESNEPLTPSDDSKTKLVETNTTKPAIVKEVAVVEETATILEEGEEKPAVVEQEQDPALMDQMLMMNANQVFTSAQEQQLQKSKLKSKSAVKMKTFYGGEEINDVNSIQPPAMPPSQLNYSNNNNNGNNKSTSSIDYFNFEFIGAGVKLEKSILIINNSSVNNNNSNSSSNNSNVTKQTKKKLDSNGATLRVNFTDIAETYEYPSFEFLLKEMGIDPATDPDYQTVPAYYDSNNENDENHHNQHMVHLSSTSTFSSSSTSSFSQFLPGRSSSTDSDDDDEDDGADADESSDYNSIITKNSIFFSSTNGENSKQPLDTNDSNNNTTKFNKLGINLINIFNLIFVFDNKFHIK